MGMLSDLFGDNHKAYDKYGNEIEGLAGQYDPYIKDGKKMLSDLTNKGQWMTNSPWALEDEMQSHYNESPGFKYSQNQLTNRMNNNAALTGQLGNGAENASLQSALEGRLNQNMGQYVDRGINTFNNGINTESNINNMGFNALGQKNQSNLPHIYWALRDSPIQDLRPSMRLGHNALCSCFGCVILFFLF